jgi:hypothetical protein
VIHDEGGGDRESPMECDRESPQETNSPPLTTHLPDWDRQHLVAVVRRQRGFCSKASVGKTRRHLVNMLRHQYTNYDECQSTERFVAACRAIATAYEWLATECERQIAWRLRRDSIAAQRSSPRLSVEDFHTGISGVGTTLV